MTNIVAAGNTYNPSLLILKSKGYELSAEMIGDRMHWSANQGDCSFMGESPAELLGIVTLWENFGEDWNRQQPNLLGEICDQMPD